LRQSRIAWKEKLRESNASPVNAKIYWRDVVNTSSEFVEEFTPSATLVKTGNADSRRLSSFGGYRRPQ
jgi:hypothetical protein